MPRTSQPWSVVVCLALLSACTSPPPPEAHVALGGEVVARVGEVTITKGLVGKVALAKGVTPRAALALLVEDALFAQQARADGVETRVDVRWAIRAALARATAARIRDTAGPDTLPSAEEVDRLTAAHAWDLDRGAARQVMHAVVHRKEKPPFDEEGGKAVAEAILAATAKVPNDRFEAAAKAVPNEWKLTVETLSPFVEDGRSQDGTSLDEAFAKGAFQIPEIGDTRLVESRFGWHVIRLLQKAPPVRVPFEQRRTLFASEAFRDRGKKAIDDLLARLRRETPPVVDPSAAALMSSVVEAR